jgi:hypothetical protein
MVRHKLRHLVRNDWVGYDFPKIYQRDEIRIVSGVNAGDIGIVQELVSSLQPPFSLLYVLHTSRGEAQVGRYQSPSLTSEEVFAVLAQYAEYLLTDSRFDLWIYSSVDQSTIVLDRHNFLFVYGQLDKFERYFAAFSFSSGELPRFGAHQHAYMSEFDADAVSLLVRYDWVHSPLRPEDEQ